MVFKKGYKQTEEHRNRIRLSVIKGHKENPNYGMKGKKQSKETREKISLSHTGKIMSEKAKKNWKNSMDKLRKEGKLVAWNKGLTPRKGKYKSNYKKAHKEYCSHIGNHPYIPQEMVIHHINLDPKDNSKDNLVMMNKSTHHKLHNKICLMMRN